HKLSLSLTRKGKGSDNRLCAVSCTLSLSLPHTHTHTHTHTQTSPVVESVGRWGGEGLQSCSPRAMTSAQPMTTDTAAGIDLWYSVLCLLSTKSLGHIFNYSNRCN